MTSKISIDDLYSDAGTFDEQAVLQELQGKVVFTKDSEVLFVVDPSKFKARETILLYVLAKKVLKANNKIDDEIITNLEVVNKTNLNKNTVNVTIMRLKKKKILMPSGSGYGIPTFKVAEALESLKNNKDK